MSTVIKDGRSGLTAEVDSSSRLQVKSSSQTEDITASLLGDEFSIDTDEITLTSANESGVMHTVNTDTVDWVVTRVFANTGASTGGSGHWKFKILAEATAGTLISGGTAFVARNLNMASAKVLSGTFLKGAEGDTVTDGSIRVNSVVSSDATRLLIQETPFVIPPGGSFTILITPPSGNTSFLTQSGVVVHRNM